MKPYLLILLASIVCLELQIDDFSLESPVLFGVNNTYSLETSPIFFGHQRLLQIISDNPQTFTYIGNGQWVVGFDQNGITLASVKWFGNEIMYDLSDDNLYISFSYKVDIPTIINVKLGDSNNSISTFNTSIVGNNISDIRLSRFVGVNRKIINSIEISTLITNNIDLIIKDPKIITKNTMVKLINENYQRCSESSSSNSTYVESTSSGSHFDIFWISVVLALTILL